VDCALLEMHALILVEGETEMEFIGRIAEAYFPHCPKSMKNLFGNFSINRKILDKAVQFAENNPDKLFKILVCIDQERRGVPAINVGMIVEELRTRKINAEVIPIIATLMTESLFFADIEGIYVFLRAPHAKRNPDKYSNFRALTHVDLSKLFRQFDKRYRKGKRVENFVHNLDLEKLIGRCEELRTLIAHCR
jgi:hypothetical protein